MPSRTLAARLFAASLLGLGSLSGVFACSATSPSPAGADGGTAGSAGTAGQGGASGFGGSTLDASPNDSGHPECAKDVYSGELIPLDLYLLLDRSASMLEPDENGLQRWSAITQAIKNFVNLPSSGGLSVGLGYFPNTPSKPAPTTCANPDSCFPYIAQCVFGACCYSESALNCESAGVPTSSCLAEDYRFPSIPIAELPGAATAIHQSIDNTTPLGTTPMGPALEGAIDYAQGWAAQHTDRITAVVLATDGAPYGCNPEGTDIVAARAAEGLSQTPSVLTFVVGLGEQLAVLNSIAIAGGTKEATLVDSGANAGAEFLSALNKIRGDLQCTYAIPTPREGEDFDPNKLNVSFQEGDQAPEFVPRVDGGAQCGLGKKAGWYYDNPTNPSRVTLCKHSCTAVQGGGIQVEVVLGCPTVVR
ncbi:MAG: hypothetical protein KIT72_06120 [Polyangiaceae bacterium]|nr:hypothetical protein [Polyangiaceae bacterium]MCW5789976.1 hypothetical protein [Polyangiaceae bacterium]